MFFTVNVMVIGCFSLLTLCYLDVFHCERYVLWMFVPVNVMIYRFFHCYGYKKDVGLLVIFYFINMN